MLDPDISTNAALGRLSRPETDPHLLDRRRFLQLVGMGVGAGLVAGPGSSLLDSLVLGHDPSTWAAGPVGPTDGILVVIGMFGGNDGLNTVVPFNDGDYYSMHGNLAIPGSRTLAVDGDVGLHPELTEFKRLWDAGHLAIVDGVGYPAPDLSHFNSMAYWMAGRPNAVPSNGWLGRWLDGYLAGGKDLFAAAEVGTSLPLHLVGHTARGTVVPPSRPAFGAGTSTRELLQYDAIRKMRTSTQGPWFEAVSQAFSDQLDLAKTLAPVIPDEAQLDGTEIVARLEVAARLINANLGFRVLTAGWGDFDSHADQPSQHPLRMRELNAAVKRFFELLDPAWSSRVTVMTFSEFGRTPWNNDGLGTDHGTSAPQLVIGQNVQGGRYGQRPSLAGLGRWDRMEHHVDFRSFYASIIDGWLGGGSTTVLGGTFEDLRLFRSGPGLDAGGSTVPGPTVVAGRSRLVPLTPSRIVDTRTGLGGIARKLNPGESFRVKVAGRGGVPPTGAVAVVANVAAVAATSPMYFTVYPGSTARPGTANLNARPGRPVPNLVVMALGADGCIEVFNSSGTTHCVVDVFGYFAADRGDGFTALRPARLFDTRAGTGIRRGTLGSGTFVDVPVAGRAGVPASGATAVVLNLAAVRPESSGWLRVTPTGRSSETTANVNFWPGDTVTNLVICPLGPDGGITLHGEGAGIDAVADVFGYFGSSGSQLRCVPSRRVLDTRSGFGAERRRVGPDHSLRLNVVGGGAAPRGASAVVLNVASVNATKRSYLTVWPAGEQQPGTSSLNPEPGEARASLVICRLGADGAVEIANPNAECDVIADVFGYFVD